MEYIFWFLCLHRQLFLRPNAEGFWVVTAVEYCNSRGVPFSVSAVLLVFKKKSWSFCTRVKTRKYTGLVMVVPLNFKHTMPHILQYYFSLWYCCAKQEPSVIHFVFKTASTSGQALGLERLGWDFSQRKCLPSHTHRTGGILLEANFRKKSSRASSNELPDGLFDFVRKVLSSVCLLYQTHQFHAESRLIDFSFSDRTREHYANILI